MFKFIKKLFQRKYRIHYSSEYTDYAGRPKGAIYKFDCTPFWFIPIWENIDTFQADTEIEAIDRGLQKADEHENILLRVKVRQKQERINRKYVKVLNR